MFTDEFGQGGLLAKNQLGVPRLWATLDASFHLESLEPSDRESLTRVVDLVADWFGDRLRWSWSSTHTEVSPHRRDDFDLVELYPEDLERKSAGGSPDDEALLEQLAAAPHDEFFVAMHGGVERNEASPFFFEFSSEILDPGQGKYFRNAPVVHLCVPLDWPLADFHEKIVQMASLLRLRWAVAGLGYGGWHYDAPTATFGAVHAHARRFAGFDVGCDSECIEVWQEEIRTVSWLTFLGPMMLAKLNQRGGTLDGRGLVDVRPLAAGVLLQAGAQPMSCDLNRLRLDPAYVRADEMVRPIRARKDVDFGKPWTQKTTEQWLRRFEKRIY